MASCQLRAAVIGAGVAGISVTHALRGIGIDVELFEQAGEARSTGYQINVYPNGIYALAKLGLLEPLRASANGGAMRFAPIFDGPTGRLVRTMRTVWDADGAYTGASFFRGDLHRVLLESMRGAPPHYGTALRSLRQDQPSDPVGVEFADGRSEEFDLVLGADGVHSQVRQALFPAHPAAVARIGSLLFAFDVDLEGPSEIERLFAEQARQGEFPQFIAPGTGVVLSHGGGGRFAAVIAIPDPADAGEIRTPEQAKDAARELVRGFRDPRVHHAVEAGYWEEGNPLVWSSADIEPLGTFSRGSIVLCGDAAHPMMPVVAQGANQSFEDAWRLSLALEGTAKSGDPGSVSAALESFSRERAPHAARVQAEGRRRILPMRFPRLSRSRLAHALYRRMLAWFPQRIFDRFDEHLLVYAIADPDCPIERP